MCAIYYVINPKSVWLITGKVSMASPYECECSKIDLLIESGQIILWQMKLMFM